ncbi:hypothetical protein NBRC10512_004815 [Rhodotorula toruloides]|uniref:RHTO0S03e03994g1_1 n=2 Tax=Rhodotorula toruloides TaxID=5286 RepID=A0A061ARY1_RHOTO|nr:uncharacterized protein RHTO_00211 [Rhodotorula toruloides NP11]EMS25783.1 hypothetical protein RHTO_00211 [Rhodotorula toruloides NP11]CDR38121.1 RHTO0S03e03994g1_1 [Rhodotorula toruloides]
MPTASDVQAALAHLLSSLPPGANPFNALHKWLWTTLKHDMPKSFYIQLYILMGIFAFNFIVLAISIGLQIAYKRFWVWRVEAGSLRPHASHTWAVPIALFYPLAIFTIARSLPWYRGTGLVDEYIGLRLTMFWLPGSGAWLATHALAAGYIQHVYMNSPDSSGANKAQRRLTWGVLLEWLAFLISMAPFCAVAHHHWTKSLDLVRDIDAKLLQQAAAFTGSFSTNDIAWLGPALLARGGQQLKVINSVRIVFGLYAGWLVVLVSFVDIAGGLHLRSLGQILRRFESIRLDGQPERSDSRQMRVFRQTYAGLVGTVAVFTVVCLSIMAFALFLAVRPQQALTDPTSMQAVDLGIYYVHAVFGGIIGLILLRFTLTTTIFAQPGDHSLSISDPSSQSRGGTFSASKRTSRSAKRAHQTMGIGVSTVVEIRHEDGTDVGGEHFELQPARGLFTPSSGSDDAKLDEKELGRLDEAEEKGVSELYFLDLEGKRENGRR